jgi:hypothetical protein
MHLGRVKKAQAKNFCVNEKDILSFAKDHFKNLMSSGSGSWNGRHVTPICLAIGVSPSPSSFLSLLFRSPLIKHFWPQTNPQRLPNRPRASRVRRQRTFREVQNGSGLRRTQTRAFPKSSRGVSNVRFLPKGDVWGKERERASGPGTD